MRTTECSSKTPLFLPFCTGSGSIAAVASLKGLVSGGDIRIQMPGGDLYISLTEESGGVRDIFLTGPTCVVFTGETYLV